MAEMIHEEQWPNILRDIPSDMHEAAIKYLSGIHSPTLKDLHCTPPFRAFTIPGGGQLSGGAMRDLVLAYISAIGLNTDKEMLAIARQANELSETANKIAKAANKHAVGANCISWAAMVIAAISAAAAVTAIFLK